MAVIVVAVSVYMTVAVTAVVVMVGVVVPILVTGERVRGLHRWERLLKGGART